jgi:hypothetical protein
MTNGANYKRGKLHHSPWHSDIRTSNQLNKCLVDIYYQHGAVTLSLPVLLIMAANTMVMLNSD